VWSAHRVSVSVGNIRRVPVQRKFTG
jgi:hypothetical protein